MTSGQKPILITVSGLTGSGKSTAARSLAALLPDAVFIDSDETRKELFGVPSTQKLPPEAYTLEATKKLIEETDRRIKAYLAEGKNVVQSVLLTGAASRARQEALALEAGADFQGIWLKADFKTMFDRVTTRTGDASDAGTDMVEKQAKWGCGDITWPSIDANQSREEVVKQALDILGPRFQPPAPQIPGRTAAPPSP